MSLTKNLDIEDHVSHNAARKHDSIREVDSAMVDIFVEAKLLAIEIKRIQQRQTE